jgi:hypothetical protein
MDLRRSRSARTGDKEPSAGNTGTLRELLAVISVISVLALLSDWPLAWVLITVAVLLSLRGGTAVELVSEPGERINGTDSRCSFPGERAARHRGDTEEIALLSPVLPPPGEPGDAGSASGPRLILP